MSGYPANWPRCRCGAPVLDGHLTCERVECGTQADAAQLIVGDVVRLERACLGNGGGATAVVVERYEIATGRGVQRPGWTLLFPNGEADGFSPSDCDLFGVERVRHDPQLATYRFHSMLRLGRDWREGLFRHVWPPA